MNDKGNITISEAVRLTGKHPDTIRAFLRKHGDKTTKDDKGRILIPYELIKDYYDVSAQTTIFEGIEQAQKEKAKEEDRHSTGEAEPKKVKIKNADDELINILKEELRSKNEQIAQQQKTIDDMQRTLTELVSQQQKLSAFMLTPKAESLTTEQVSADDKTATKQAKHSLWHWRKKS